MKRFLLALIKGIGLTTAFVCAIGLLFVLFSFMNQMSGTQTLIAFIAFCVVVFTTIFYIIDWGTNK